VNLIRTSRSKKPYQARAQQIAGCHNGISPLYILSLQKDVPSRISIGLHHDVSVGDLPAEFL
jgi:hypothetical protein